MQSAEILERLRSLANPRNVQGMARYGINPRGTLGVPIPVLRGIAKEIGTDHRLALALWKSGLHEARLLASFVADPAQTNEALLDRWVEDFDSWDVCDQVMGLVSQTRWAYQKTREWAGRDEEFVKRAAFSLIATLAVHDKRASDREMAGFFPLIEGAAGDDRNFVKKAVNWALRNLGKRNRVLQRQAIATARRIAALETRSARWIAADALRELQGEKVQAKLKAKKKRLGPSARPASSSRSR